MHLRMACSLLLSILTSSDHNYILINGTFYKTSSGVLVKDEKLSDSEEIYDTKLMNKDAFEIVYPNILFPYNKIEYLK